MKFNFGLSWSTTALSLSLFLSLLQVQIKGARFSTRKNSFGNECTAEIFWCVIWLEKDLLHVLSTEREVILGRKAVDEQVQDFLVNDRFPLLEIILTMHLCTIRYSQ
jgi:hypothetical protein